MFQGNKELRIYLESASRPSFEGFLKKHSTNFKNWHSDATVSSADAFFYLWKARYSSASLKNLRATKKTKDVATAIFQAFNPEQATLTRVNNQRYFLRDRKPVNYEGYLLSNSNAQKRALTHTRPAPTPCYIENINISVICREFQTKAMIKENEEVELELGEALSLKDIYLIKPVMDNNCALSNSSLNIIPKRTVAVNAGHSRLIDNVVQRTLHNNETARLHVIQELHSNPNNLFANVLLLLLFKYHADMSWDRMDEDIFAQTALHPFLDVIFPVGQDMIKHGQFSYLSDSKEYKPDIRYSCNEFDILIWEVKTPRSNLDDTEKLAMQLKHMLQRIISAGLGDAAVFGVVVKGFVGHVYKMIMPAVNIYLLLEIDSFQLPNNVSQFSTCVETVAVLQNLHKKICDQSRLLREIL